MINREDKAILLTMLLFMGAPVVMITMVALIAEAVSSCG